MIELSASISVHNRQRAIKLDVKALQLFAECALTHSSKLRPAISLPDIAVLFISDRRMSELHLRFLKIAGPTDVITFQHGEIFVSVETARRQAREHGTSTLEEIRLYIVHGLLHLLGFNDKTATGERRMHKLQEKIARAASEGRASARPRTRGGASLRLKQTPAP